MNRIKFLDGFRGLAIILVILFHAYSRWTEIVPYGKEFAAFPLFNKGWLGVQLFFLISGFVILMTLEKSNTLLQFLFKRWLRLFPAMLIATIFIYSTATFFYERPEGIPSFKEIFPGLVFIDPSIVSQVLRIKMGILEGAFWSLFVEVKYYLIFGILYLFCK